MKKSIAATLLVTFPLPMTIISMKTSICIVILSLASCTNTQVRWDATKMRQDVMVYYNDQIMENLIKAKLGLPFVHVDIQSLTSTGGSQISGTAGYGETITNTGTRARTNQTVTTDTISAAPSHAVAGTIGVVGTLVHAAMRPFTYSVTPLRSETLTITAAPALGSQAQALPTPFPKPSPGPTPPFERSKETKTTLSDGTLDKTSTEFVPKPSSTPKPITIYELYEDFAKGTPKSESHLSHGSKPKPGTYVPGTLKRWGDENHFIDTKDQEDYYKLCKKLFTKGQSGSLEEKILENRVQIDTLRSLQGAPPTQP